MEQQEEYEYRKGDKSLMMTEATFEALGEDGWERVGGKAKTSKKVEVAKPIKSEKPKVEKAVAKTVDTNESEVEEALREAQEQEAKQKAMNQPAAINPEDLK